MKAYVDQWLLPGRACDEFIAAVSQLGAPEHIPHFDAISERLIKATGWQVVSVPGADSGRSVLRAAGGAQVPGHRLAAQAGRV
jgi:phenylalanine-4-hydroxylase